MESRDKSRLIGHCGRRAAGASLAHRPALLFLIPGEGATGSWDIGRGGPSRQGNGTRELKRHLPLRRWALWGLGSGWAMELGCE